MCWLRLDHKSLILTLYLMTSYRKWAIWQVMQRSTSVSSKQSAPSLLGLKQFMSHLSFFSLFKALEREFLCCIVFKRLWPGICCNVSVTLVLQSITRWCSLLCTVLLWTTEAQLVGASCCSCGRQNGCREATLEEAGSGLTKCQQRTLLHWIHVIFK